MTAINSVKLTKFYKGEKQASLDGLSLEVQENTIYGFLGPNGAGKTTTIKILTGLMKASSGKAFVAGHEVKSDSLSLRSAIGYLGQEPKMYGWMKGKELLLFVGEIFGLPNEERNKRADFLLELSDLKNAAKKKISAYSGGMIQRLGIAQALMGKPKVLFLDEPTSSLDPIGRKEVLEFIKTLSEECTVFMSTHILSDVERICTDVGIINQGKLIVQDKTANLRKKYASGKLEIDFSNTGETERFKTLALNSNLPGQFDISSLSAIYNPLNLDNERHLINKIIADHAIEINRIELLNATLEDVFIQLIEQNSKLAS